MRTLTIGYADGERLTIEPLAPPAKNEGYDWMPVRAAINVGGFHGCVDLMITLSDLTRFHQRLLHLYTTLKGEAEFTTLEDQINFKLTAGKLGGIAVSGYLKDQLSDGNSLAFSFAIDQTFLPQNLADLEEMIKI